MKFNKYFYGFDNSIKKALKVKAEEKVQLANLKLNEIIVVDFPDDQYIRNVTNKKQIVLHHTVSGQGVDGDISWWRQTTDRVGTAVIIGWDGKIYQCFSSKYWAYHLGVKGGKKLNMESIGIEIDSWGGLVQENNSWYPAKWDKSLQKSVANTKFVAIPNDKVQIYDEPFRGYYGFEKYSDAQIEAVRQLLVYWGGRYNIPLEYNEGIFEYSPDALVGKSGVWSHTSFRKDKSDIHPQPELVKMLKSL